MRAYNSRRLGPPLRPFSDDNTKYFRAAELSPRSGVYTAMHRTAATLRWGLIALLLAGSIAISSASVSYLTDDMPPFLLEKLPLPRQELWLLALRMHVVAAAIALPGCLLLISKWVLRRTPRLHRWLGRIVGVTTLAALAPSGFYLSLSAKGGLSSTLGFMLSGAIVVVAMVQGVRTARAGRYAQHRRAVLHVLAQLSVAVTSRALLVALAACSVDDNTAYVIALWVPVVCSALAIERIVSPRRYHETSRADDAAVRYARVGGIATA